MLGPGRRKGGKKRRRGGTVAGRKSPSPSLIETQEEPSTPRKRGGDARMRGGSRGR